MAADSVAAVQAPAEIPVKLSWTPSTDQGVSGYFVRWSTNPDMPKGGPKIDTLEPKATLFLVPGPTYYAVVSAYQTGLITVANVVRGPNWPSDPVLVPDGSIGSLPVDHLESLQSEELVLVTLTISIEETQDFSTWAPTGQSYQIIRSGKGFYRATIKSGP